MRVYTHEQLEAALISAAVGLLLGLLYDVFRAIRICVGRRAAEALLDICFCLASLAALFCLGMRFGGGDLHTAPYLFAALGFVAYFASISRALCPILCRKATILRRLVKNACSH